MDSLVINYQQIDSIQNNRINELNRKLKPSTKKVVYGGLIGAAIGFLIGIFVK